MHQLVHWRLERLTMDLYLIRHSQSINNKGDNHVDFPELTDLGYKQAYLAGKALKDINPVKLYCSPMLRAVQTAQKIGSVINLDPQIIVELHEGGGVYTLAPGKRIDGLKRSEILESCPQIKVKMDEIKKQNPKDFCKKCGKHLSLLNNQAYNVVISNIA